MPKIKSIKVIIPICLILILATFSLSLSCSGNTPATSSAPAAPQTSAAASPASAPAPQTSAVAPPPASSAPAPTQATTQPAQPSTLKIGFLTGLTGWASIGTLHQVRGAEIAVKMINDKGGITVAGQKYQIQLVEEDDKGTTDGSVAGVNKLIFDEKVKFIAGFPLWFLSASKSITEPAKVIRSAVWTCCTPGELGADTPYTFLCASATLEQALAVLDYIKQTQPAIKTLACIYPDDGTPKYTGATIKSMMDARGLSMAGDFIVYPNDMSDFSPIAAKVQSTKADAILQVNGWGNHAAGILKNVRELGDARYYFGAVPTSAGEVLSMSGKDVATKFCCVAPMAGATGNPALLETVAKQLEKTDAGPLSQLALNGFDSVWVMVQAIQAANSLDTTVVRDTWEKMKNIETSYGASQMGSLKTYGIAHSVNKPCSIQLLDKGEVKFGAWMNSVLP
jgi:branched-chain amino acid transport system substrate-binding protein